MRNPNDPRWPNGGRRTELRDEADRWRWPYLDLIYQGYRAETFGVRSKRLLGASVDAYLTHRELTVERTTLTGDRAITSALLERFGRGADAARIDLQAFLRERASLGYRPSTLLNNRIQLQAFYRWLDVPMPKVELPKPAKADARSLTDAEIITLRTEAGKIDAAHLLIVDSGLFIGLRRGEILGLRWSDIDAAERSARIQRQVRPGSTGTVPLKGKRARTVWVLPAWNHAPNGDEWVVPRMSPRTLDKRVGEVLQASGLKDTGVAVHVLRHTYSRLVLAQGATKDELQRFLGHSSVRTTEGAYEHFGPDDAVRAVVARTAR